MKRSISCCPTIVPVGLFGFAMNTCRVRQADRSKHCVEIVRKARIGHLDRLRPKELGHQRVNRKGMAGRDHLVSGPEKGVTDELDDFVRAVAKHNVLPVKAQLLGDGTAQCPSAAVGIKVRALERLTHRCQRLWRRAERVFVRGQLDDLRRAASPFRVPVPRRACRARRRQVSECAGARSST